MPCYPISLHLTSTNLNGDRTKMVADKMVYGQNVIGQNGMDKMIRTECYGQNGSKWQFSLFQNRV